MQVTSWASRLFVSEECVGLFYVPRHPHFCAYMLTREVISVFTIVRLPILKSRLLVMAINWAIQE